MTRKCKFCKTEFTKVKPWQLYCKLQCKNAAGQKRLRARYKALVRRER
jgi:hypothetical protein